jgi:hypothetical protein
MQCPVIGSRDQAVRLLPVCMDKAIAALKRLADRDNVAMSDLAAAYYVRAATKDKPEDYLNAYDAAEHAVNATPRPEWAEGNRAVIEKALGLEKIEIASFDADEPKSVARYPASALLFLENELLPGRIPEARRLATQIVQITGDRYPLDEVEACAAAGPALRGKLPTQPLLNNCDAATARHRSMPTQRLQGRPMISGSSTAWSGKPSNAIIPTCRRGYCRHAAMSFCTRVAISFRSTITTGRCVSMNAFTIASELWPRTHDASAFCG